jgi:hypothetical protein
MGQQERIQRWAHRSKSTIGVVVSTLWATVLLWVYLIAPVQAQAVPTSPSPSVTPKSVPSVTPPSSIQPYLDRVMRNVTEFQLDNGMKFVVLERHNAPVVSFLTYVDVGGADEDPGKTGISHFLEHLAFKGTTQIGTTDFAKEKPLLDRQDTIFAKRLRKRKIPRLLQPSKPNFSNSTVNCSRSRSKMNLANSLSNMAVWA